MATSFDTLKFANSLKDAGVPDKQAEAQARVLGEALAVNFKELATRNDLTTALGSLRSELQSDIRETEQRLNAKIDGVEQRLDAKIDGVEQRLDAKIDGVEQRLDAKIGGVEQRLDAKIGGVEQRLDAKIDSVEKGLNAKIDNLAAKFEGQFTLLKWMLGLSISLSVGVLIRLFLVRVP